MLKRLLLFILRVDILSLYAASKIVKKSPKKAE